MNAKCKRNRMFGTCILLMMTVLAVCTAVFAAEGESSSYSLIIEKVFDFTSIESDPKLSQDAKEDFKSQARNQEYTFKISGTRIDSGKTVKVDETFTLPRKDENGDIVWNSQTYTSNDPFDVMVTELTDNIEITDKNGNHYNMSDSSSDTSISVNSRKYEMQLRNNATISIERPADDGSSNNSQELWYRVTNRPYDGHSNNNFESLDMVFPLAAGEKTEITEAPSGDILRAAIYTIEQVAAPDGYQLQMGTREETVSKDNGGVGHFHINGTPGMLTLTAGGSKGDGATHYYVIERTEMDAEDTSEFVPRTVPVPSGENYILHNLPRGGYTVSEYTIAAGEAFKVTVPQTEERTRTEKSSGLTNGTSNSWKYMDLNDLDFDVDYIKMVSFGPLYNSSGNKLNSTTSYAVFRYGIASDDGKLITNIKTYSKSDGFKGNISYTVSDASEIKLNKTKRLYFTATGVKSSTAKKIGVSWIEYDVKETEKTFKSVDKAESVTVDERKWIRIEAPALGDPNAAGADQVAYYYTIKDQNGNLVPGTTDREDTTVKLKPGSGAELELPEAGSYTIAESVVGNSPVGFTMKIEGYPFGTTQADKEIEVQVGGERTVTISKPALINPPDGANDNRDYIFNVTGTDFSEKVIIKTGESKTIALPKAGKYTVRPEKDTLGTYHLNYVDSGAVYGTASGSTGTVTFTNFFSVGEYGYRYIHEYYVKDEDGSYSYEGNSQITTRLGRSNVDEIHDAAGIRKAPIFNENNYEHFDEAYGRVDPITISPIWEEPSLKSDEGEEPETSEEDNPESGENEETETPDEDNPESDKDGEPDTSGEDSPESDKDGEPDTPKEDSSDSDKEEEPEFPGEDNSGSAEGEGTELSGEDSPESDKNEKPESSDEDVSSPAENGEPVLFSEDFQNNDEDTGADHSDEAGLNPAENGELGDSDENNTDNPDSDGGEEPEIPNEDDPASNEDKDPETSEKDGPDSSENEDQDVPDEDSLDSSKDKEPISSEEDNPKLNEGEEQKSLSPESITEKTKAAISSDDEFSDGESNESGESHIENVFTGEGIIDKGTGIDSSGKALNYEPISGRDSINVTRDASQIVILRYYRERQPAGKYNVIHVYYLRDEKGDHWEGTSGIQPQDGELGIKYTGQRVDKAYDFQPENEDRPYTYTWDGRPQYGEVDESDHMGDFDPDTNEFAGDGKVYRPNNSWTAAEGTKEGNQIIILRYYRELSKEGQYNIVHEYYSREDSESQDSAEDSGSGGGTEENPERERTVLRSRSIRAENGEEEEISDTFTGTLNRDDGFVYTFEGRTGMESVTAPLGSTHTAGEDDWKLAYEGNTYTYIDSGYGAVSDDTNYSSNPNQQWASATEEGNEVIILRYYRESDEPDSPISGVSYKVVHEYYVRDREGSQTLVGISAIDEVTDAAPNEHYTQEHIRKEPVFQGDSYTYFDWGCGTASGQSYSQISGKEYVEATESGDQIIILRYYRQPDDPLPTDSPKYDEREEETEDSDITSEKSTKALKASGSPAKPSAAGGADSPDVSNAQDGKRPKTGDDSRIALWVILAAVSLGGLAIVRLIQRKRNGK